MHVETALKSPETIKACAVLAQVHAAMELMTDLPPPALEALRDAFKEMAETRTGPRGELKRAWLNYTEQALHDARFRERQETFGMYKDVGGRP
jgi:hypothetical protein